MRIGILTDTSPFLYGKDGKYPTDQLFMGWAVGILKKYKDFYQVVTHYGYTGYLGKNHLKITSENYIKQRDLAQNLWIVTAPFADVLSEPRVQGKRLITLEKGSFVELLEERESQVEASPSEHGFVKIRTASEVTGYIPRIAVTKRLDSDGYLYCPPNRRQYYFLRQRGLPEQKFRETAVSFAKSYLRTPYRWAGKSQQGIDCSGLTFMSFLFSGIMIYRDAKIHPNYPVKSIPPERIKPGDLLYFPGHIALYLGEEKYIHATGNKNSFACVVNSFDKNDDNYREDLAESLYAVGSIF